MKTQHIEAVVEQVWTHYFTPGITAGDTPLFTAGLAGMFGFGFLAFLTMGLNTVPLVFFALAAASFTVSLGLHFLLWIAGSLYRHGVFGSLKHAGFFLFGLTALVLGGGFLLYGWVIPLFALSAAYGILVPEPFASILLPVYIIFIFVFAGAWYTKGLAYIEGHGHI